MSSDEEEVETIQRGMSVLTGATFEITAPRARFPLDRLSARWFVMAPELDAIDRTAHANAVWEDKGGIIWIESTILGDTTEWIEEAYGEKGGISVMKMDLSNFANETVRKGFAEKFPNVDERLREYEAILAHVSSERGAALQMRYDGGEGIVSFYADARIEGSGLEEKLEKIALNVKALKEARDRIDEYERKRHSLN
jgi:hypothetical protein